jgi:hypothetical protein
MKNKFELSRLYHKLAYDQRKSSVPEPHSYVTYFEYFKFPALVKTELKAFRACSMKDYEVLNEALFRFGGAFTLQDIQRAYDVCLDSKLTLLFLQKIVKGLTGLDSKSLRDIQTKGTDGYHTAI